MTEITDKRFKRNALRMQIWSLDEQIRAQYNLPKSVRNFDKIEALQDQIHTLEAQIQEML